MPAIAIVAPDGTVLDVVVGTNADIRILNQRFPRSQALPISEGLSLTRGDNFDRDKRPILRRLP